MTAPVVSSVAELTAEWLSDTLGKDVETVTVEQIGTGQIGTCFRLDLTGVDEPTRMLAKLPAADPATREMLSGVYRSEVRFYSEIAATVAIRVPECYYADISDSGADFTLLLQDMSPAEQGDQLVGCTVAQARDAVENLAGLHGPRWCDPSLLEIDGLAVNGPEDAKLLAEMYGPATEIFIDGLGDLIADEDRATLWKCVDVAENWALARSGRFGLVHGDYRLDNLLFPPNGGPGVTAIDWQTLSLALPARDLAYFIGTSLSPAERRENERELVAGYHRALQTHGAPDYTFENCWEDYCFAMIQGPLVSVFGCAYGARTERGDKMFAAMVARSCAAIRDVGTIELAGSAQAG
ncbi:phosphotransferase family protein [Williamsia soli]|uniref:phosphotransferase family protein n=1 Tax=Williamsia soli TaxID=364929 RepID=UPI001A9F5070|nr:phosphotransferase [Williamsia soli]